MGYIIFRVDIDSAGKEHMTRHRTHRFATEEQAKARARTLNRAHKDLPVVFLVRPVEVELLA